MRIHFLGAAGHVTGSMYLIEVNDTRFLVDAGLFQGNLEETRLNMEIPLLDLSTVDFMILTHAHIDHSGRIPLIVKNGFKGKIYCTYATRSLAEILMRDSGKIHEVENEWENKKRKRAGLDPVDPLYTEEDAIIACQYLFPINYYTKNDPASDISFELKNAGHLLGSSIVVLSYIENAIQKKIVFSGDLGNGTSFLEERPDTVDNSDYLVVESTYGNRLHHNIEKRGQALINIILKAYEEGGTVLIPSFAVGRTQEILFEIKHYIHTHDNRASEVLRKIPIYLDSPLALDATDIYKSYSTQMSELIQTYGDSPFQLKNLTLIKHIEDSIKLNFNTASKVIISASGMCDAGRIKHHLKHNLWKPNTHVAIVGYQAEETLGRLLLEGATEVTIFDETIAVKAHIHKVEGFSGHADQTQLFNWVKSIQGIKKAIVVHGEPESSLTFANQLQEELNLSVVIPKLNAYIEL